MNVYSDNNTKYQLSRTRNAFDIEGETNLVSIRKKYIAKSNIRLLL